MEICTACKEKADKIFVNGRIYTVDKGRSWAEAVAVRGNKIIYVGKNEDAVALAGKGTEVINLEGRMMLPGFIDSHAHPIMAAYFKSGIIMNITEDLSTTLARIETYVKENPGLDSYFGQGFSEWMFDAAGPQKELLDQICKDKPMILLGAGGHSGWCNSKALEAAGITKDTPDPDPGAQFFRRNAYGEPSGGLVESKPMLMVIDAVKPFREKQVKEALRRMTEEYGRAGVTAIQDGGANAYMLDLGRPLVVSMQKTGEFRQRIQSCDFVTSADLAEGAIERILNAKEEYNDDYFRVDFLKILNDGSFEARSAALLKPYTEDGSMCHPMLEGKALQDLFLQAAEVGMDIAVHGIGDRTIRETLTAAGTLRKAGFDDIRVTSIHCNYIAPEDLDKFAEYRVIANTTPVWHHENKDKERIIGERAHKNFLMNTLYKKGVNVTFSSDYPTDEFGKEPLKGVEMGITRQLFDQPEQPVLLPLSERLTVAKMIEGYTINAAYQMRMEDKIGSIEAGKYADLVVLSENLFEIDPHDIHKVSVEMTVFDGETTSWT